MRDSGRNVGRADHNVAGARRAAQTDPTDADPSPAVDSADRHGHGAHGKGSNSEKATGDAEVDHDHSKGSDRGGSAGWGSEGSGGSVIDKR